MSPSSRVARHETQSGKEAVGSYFVLVAVVVFVFSLYPLSRTNYLLFHSLIELCAVAVSVTLFSIGWNTREFSRNDGLTLLAISFLVVAALDLLHTLAYKGMGVFPSAGVDPPTQLWIAARSVQAVSYLLAACLFGSSGGIKPWRTLSLYLVIGIFLVSSIWPWQIFPSCLSEVTGLTNFKVGAEYLISLTLLVSAAIFWNRRHPFDRRVRLYFMLSIGTTVLSELAFTLYLDVYGISNFLGHFLKLGAIVFLYRAFVFGTLRTPYQTLFSELSESHIALDRELTIRRNTEKQLRDANRDLDAFVRTASHDLRSPLTVMTTGAELLQKKLAGQINPELENILKSIYRQGHRMSELLNALLSLARVGTMSHPPEQIELKSIAVQAIEALSQEITANRCHVAIEEMPEIKAHPSLIYQILLNLIANAVRYGTNPEKPVQIGADINENTCRIFVRDHGPGVVASEREKIFDVFYRSPGSQNSHGSGIGLATVQKIARYYSGKAFIEETPGGGATFYVEFEMPESEVSENGLHSI